MTEDKIFLMFHGRVWTRGQVGDFVHSTARKIREVGVRPGDIVPVEARVVPETILMFLSLWRAGAVVCPIGPGFPVPVMTGILDRLGPVTAAVTRSQTWREARPGLRMFRPDELICSEPVERFFAAAPDGPLISDQPVPATAVLTSGSSGVPKIAVHGLSAHLANARGAASMIPFSGGDTWLMSLPLHHVSGLGVLFRAVTGGGAIVFPEPGTWSVDVLMQSRSTHVSLVPAQLKRLMAAPPAVLADLSRSLKAVLVGGGPLPSGLMDQALAAGLPVFGTYGMTETGSQVATAPWAECRRRGARVLPGHEVRVEDGLIEVRGDALLLGYWDRGKVTPAVGADGWFSTGDRGVLVADGAGGRFLGVHGRRDRMFVSGGENVHPEAVERTLREAPGVVAVRVDPCPDAELGQAAVARVRVEVPAAFNAVLLRDFLKARLPAWQVPRRIVLDQELAVPGK